MDDLDDSSFAHNPHLDDKNIAIWNPVLIWRWDCRRLLLSSCVGTLLGQPSKKQVLVRDGGGIARVGPNFSNVAEWPSGRPFSQPSGRVECHDAADVVDCQTLLDTIELSTRGVMDHNYRALPASLARHEIVPQPLTLCCNLNKCGSHRGEQSEASPNL
jgi:hypothetical protein